MDLKNCRNFGSSKIYDLPKIFEVLDSTLGGFAKEISIAIYREIGRFEAILVDLERPDF
jgi:hypothetical protein